MKSYPMTETGKVELEKKLAYLKEVKQAALKEKIKVARGFCDFGEDVVFREMIDSQADVEAEIKRIENILANAKLITSTPRKSVELGSRVTFKEVPDGEAETYRIVGQVEADLAAQKISADSSIGQGLLGNSVGDLVTVPVPEGDITVKIIKHIGREI